MSPNAGWGGCWVLASEYSCAHGAQIDIGDLTPYLTFGGNTEAESKEKHGVWDPMPELTSPYIHSRDDSNTLTMGNPMPESTLTLCQSRLYPPVREFGFSLCIYTMYIKL